MLGTVNDDEIPLRCNNLIILDAIKQDTFLIDTFTWVP